MHPPRTAALALALALAGAAGAAGAAPAPPTARQIVARSLTARGGAARFAAVRSYHFRGRLMLAQGAVPLEVWGTVRPARIRMELRLPQGRLVQAWDGRQAWQIAPGGATAAVLSAAAARQLQDQALNGLDLIAAPEAAEALAGQGELDGHAYLAVRFTLATGDSFTQYFDTRTWLAFHELYPGGVESISDYRRVGGLLLPFRYVSGAAGKPGTPLVRSAVQLNPAIPAALFAPPGGAGKSGPGQAAPGPRSGLRHHTTKGRTRLPPPPAPTPGPS
jgi:hypothetical protein